jgi:hypothetical protein
MLRPWQRTCGGGAVSVRSSYRKGNERNFAKNLRASLFHKDQPNERPLLARSTSMSSTFKGSQAEEHLEVPVNIFLFTATPYPVLWLTVAKRNFCRNDLVRFLK